MEAALIGVCCALPVAACAGFVAGVRYAARRVPNFLARLHPGQLRAVAHRTNELRRQAA